MEEKNKVVGAFICIAVIAALLSIFAPFVAVSSYYYSESLTGIEILEMAMEEGDEGFPMVAMAATGLGLLFTWVSMRDGSRYGLSMLCSIVAGGSMWIYFSEGMDYVTSGFWIFMVSHVVAVVLGGSLYLHPQGSSAVKTMDTVQKANGQCCPNCGAWIAAGSKFCSKCGAPQRNPAAKNEHEF